MPTGTAELMYLLLLSFAVLFLYGLYRRFHPYGIRHLWQELIAHPSRSIAQLIRFALLQEKVAQARYGGIMHLLIFFGTLILFLGTALVFLDLDLLRNLGFTLLQGPFYLLFEVSLDAFGLLFLAGLVTALIRRSATCPSFLENKTEYFTVLLVLLYIGVTGFLLEGFRLALHPVPWSSWSPVGNALASLITSAQWPLESSTQLYQGLWWSHALTTFGLVAAIPFTSLIHIFSSTLNAMIAPPKPQGSLPAPFNLIQLMASGTFDVNVGFERITDLSWKQKLGLDACTNCGRCEAVCPATASGTPLSPRRVVQHLRTELLASTHDGDRGSILSRVVTADEIWACTMCGACIQACPVLINPMEYLAELRRTLVAKSQINVKQSTMLDHLARAANPYGLPTIDRDAVVWELGGPSIRENPHPEYVYWLGCAATYDPRAREVARAVVKILKAAGVNFALLGALESCTGDPARRAGEEGRFQELALRNIEVFKRHNVQKIIVHCPHCYNTLKNEYGFLGLSAEVVHHAVFINQLLANGRVVPKRPVRNAVTLHDSCYVGRFNEVFNEPRHVLTAVPGLELREMHRIKEKSFCCGAGGANYWYDVPQQEKTSVIRSKEAAATGAGVLAVECPFCLAMFPDAIKLAGLEDRMKVKDIAEIVAESL